MAKLYKKDVDLLKEVRDEKGLRSIGQAQRLIMASLDDDALEAVNHPIVEALIQAQSRAQQNGREDLDDLILWTTILVRKGLKGDAEVVKKAVEELQRIEKLSYEEKDAQVKLVEDDEP